MNKKFRKVVKYEGDVGFFSEKRIKGKWSLIFYPLENISESLILILVYPVYLVWVFSEQVSGAKKVYWEEIK